MWCVMTNIIMQILMQRDGMNKIEAMDYFSCVRRMIYEAINTGNLGRVEYILFEELGLEMDYIYDIL